MTDNRRIVLLGAGNVATHLARALAGRCRIVQVYSRTAEHARRLADELGAAATDDLANLVPDADIYLMAVADDAIASIAAAVPDNGALWLHTAGSVGLDALAAHRRHCGVLYPLQTLSRDIPVNWDEVTLYVEAGDAESLNLLLALARQVSPRVEQCDSARRMALHVAAVMACNFVNHLWVEADDLLSLHHLDFAALRPLIAGTVAKLDHATPLEAQTGPARRGDRAVMSRHAEALHGTTRELYQALSQAIMRRHGVSGGEPDFGAVRGMAFDVDGVLSPATIPMDAAGEPARMLNIKDGYAIQLAARMGLPIAIISGARTESVRERYRGLGVKDIYLGASHKLPIFNQWLELHGLQAEQVAYVGDDIPDLPVLRVAGLPVAPADACREVLAAARYVVPCRGGHGVARHVIERVLTARGQWMADDRAFGW